MRVERFSDMVLRTASLAVIRTVKRRKRRLRRSGYRPITCRRALPLDFSDNRPFESSLDRNIEAILSESTCC